MLLASTTLSLLHETGQCTWFATAGPRNENPKKRESKETSSWETSVNIPVYSVRIGVIAAIVETGGATVLG